MSQHCLTRNTDPARKSSFFSPSLLHHTFFKATNHGQREAIANDSGAPLTTGFVLGLKVTLHPVLVVSETSLLKPTGFATNTGVPPATKGPRNTKYRSTAFSLAKREGVSVSKVTKENMAFPFFRLPKELRDMIYEEVFQTSLQDGAITPDPHYLRRRGSGDLNHRTINNGLALLQSCQQVHEEATAILYGNHVFYFDDTRHDHWSTKIDVTAHCYYCQRLRGHRPGDGLTYGDRCYDADGFGLKHEILISECDFISMPKWLSAIGAKNRLLIRHIQLHFSTSQFTKVLGAVHVGGRPGKPSPVGGGFLEEGLQLLALGHNLETMTISFEVPKEGEYSINLKDAPLELFSVDYFQSDRLRTALCDITGIKTLVCEPAVGKHTMRELDGSYTDLTVGVDAGVREVRDIMEAGYEMRTEQQIDATFSSCRIDQVNSSIQKLEVARKLALRELSYAEVARLGAEATKRT